MTDKDEKFNKFKQLVLDLFEGNFLLEESKAPYEDFLKTDKAESIIKKHFDAGGERKNAEDADSELIREYQFS